MHGNFFAVLFALSSALTIAWGTVVRHRIAEETPTGAGERSPIMFAMARPLWWAGLFTALMGYGLQIVALGFGTLLVVQPILVLSLMFSLPLSARYTGRRLSHAEIIWGSILTIAVAVLVVLGRPLAGDSHPPLERWLPALIIAAVILIPVERVAHRLFRSERALLLGMVTGGVFGFVSVLSKAVVDIFVSGGLPALMHSWELYTLIAGAIIGTAVQQQSFNAGALKNSLPAMTITEPIVAFALGYAVLGEKFQVSSTAGWLAMGAALVAMVVGTVVLSRHGVD